MQMKLTIIFSVGRLKVQFIGVDTQKRTKYGEMLGIKENGNEDYDFVIYYGKTGAHSVPWRKQHES
ncbi:hypothetical protein [Lacticaseibacillus casei]|nr:hypothetical protein [Lacticaseibacillus casei]MBI6597575.1 hypothetical protein [Lacticaseibacillus casei]MBO2416593.1 hypothetical protein [Lacticaseibacillus casei]MCK2080954.1 hypothetical protein [Lacticaseibacillus casei]MDZ5495518.1 hypothetical protein [Lacticaseibacillus casei]MED7630547.1 hypothetical protein [Lacticaseibacillus casei]